MNSEKKYDLDKYDKQQIKKAILVISEILTNNIAFTGFVKLNFFEGNLVNVNFEKRIKIEEK